VRQPLVIRAAQLKVLRRATFELAARDFLRGERTGAKAPPGSPDEEAVAKVADAMEFAASLGAADAADRVSWARLEGHRGPTVRVAADLAWLRELFGNRRLDPSLREAIVRDLLRAPG
jgi:hypothetical protein